MRIAALVLSAGASRRMGVPKALVRLGPSSFLERQLRTLAGVEGLCGRYVVLGHQAGRIRRALDLTGVRAVTARGWRGGMLASVRAAVRATLVDEPALDGLLVSLVDQPRLRATTFRALLRAAARHPGDVLVASAGGRAGHPALLPRPLLLRIVADRRPGTLAEHIAAHGGRRLVACRDPAVVENVNTPAEAAAIGATLP